jgi:hypothetical protein
MATPKILGSAPEPYDGKPEKADTFINNLGNYYFLNTTTFDTDEKKVSSALTYFKISTPAGEWAHDRQSAALSATPPDFGTWANFQTLFKAHFIPAHTELEATQYLHTNKMGNHPFNEWYQEWSTQAECSHSNAHTKMFCFRKAIPIPLHQKILGVTPAPDTMEELVRLAREFNRNYRLYTTPSDNFRGNRGPRNRAMIAENGDTQVHATSTSPCPQLNMGKISEAEKQHRYKEKLCFYCRKPGHTAKECHIKQSGRGRGQGNRSSVPHQDVCARAAATQEETYKDTPEDHLAQVAALSRLVIGQNMAPINEDF